jgi:glycosyltransferase involved in cell wall biosynthesis
LEIILVDDGSKDKSGRICDKYALIDNRIKVVHKTNGGLSDARNHALDMASGELIAFVDGDDWIHPQMYELMTGIMKCKNADVVTCWFEQKDAEFARTRYTLDELSIKQITREEALSNIRKPLVVAWNKLYKKEIFDDIRYPKGKLHEDEFIIHRIFYKCKNMVVIDQPLYFYTRRNDSIVAQMSSKRILDSLEAFADRVAYADEQKWVAVMPSVIERYCDYCIDRYYDIKKGLYETIEEGYLTMLWQSEHDMLERYPTVQVNEKYRKFAISPDVYYDWMKKIENRNKFKKIPKNIVCKIVELLGFKK